MRRYSEIDKRKGTPKIQQAADAARNNIQKQLTSISPSKDGNFSNIPTMKSLNNWGMEIKSPISKNGGKPESSNNSKQEKIKVQLVIIISSKHSIIIIFFI
jgi:hypothetical protein